MEEYLKLWVQIVYACHLPVFILFQTFIILKYIYEHNILMYLFVMIDCVYPYDHLFVYWELIWSFPVVN